MFLAMIAFSVGGILGVLISACCFVSSRVERISDQQEFVLNLTKQKDQAYSERDKVVAALSRCFPAHICRHPDEDKEWDNNWRWIVCIHLPTGQATWHIHKSELTLFPHLRIFGPGHWDGHSTEEKYNRLARLPIMRNAL